MSLSDFQPMSKQNYCVALRIYQGSFIEHLTKRPFLLSPATCLHDNWIYCANSSVTQCCIIRLLIWRFFKVTVGIVDCFHWFLLWTVKSGLDARATWRKLYQIVPYYDANTNTGEGGYYGIILSDTCTQACALLLSFIVWMLLVVLCCATFVENEIPNI